MAFILLLAALTAAPQAQTDEPTVAVTVDSAHRQVVVTAGPWDLPNMAPMTDHAMHDFGASHDTPVQQFVWPVDGWFRGFSLEVRDSQGRLLPRRIMHHLVAVNYSRRQLLYPAAERLFGAGTETEDATVPVTVGVPLSPGMKLGFYVAWHNDTGEDLSGVRLTMRLDYTPANLRPEPVNVMPLYMDVNLTVGGTNTFDVPPGRSEKSYEFVVPVSGRIIGYSGHLHDYGIEVRLEDAESGKRLARVEARRGEGGRVLGVSRSLPGIRGRGIRLKEGHRYRVVGVYLNPTGQMLPNGAMAHIAALFTPDDLRQWPAIDFSDPMFQRDLASLEMRGQAGDDEEESPQHQHQHQDHNH